MTVSSLPSSAVSAEDRQEDWSSFSQVCNSVFLRVYIMTPHPAMNWGGGEMKDMLTSISSPSPNPRPEHHELLSLVLGRTRVQGWCEQQRTGCEPLLCLSYLSVFQEVVEL